ncbi:MAG: hypothetical protein CL693_19685 [Cellvibrionaceae bacterium]|nr:hypothetical protein [Cellvibrionaceae bacterium]|tara:strand:- start:192430 stop:192762 length:333 start_codon:yes stop_codon:yes gene_type:complete
MAVDRKALAVAAREIRLQRCKASIWELAIESSRRKHTSVKVEYARLRCRELSLHYVGDAANDESRCRAERADIVAGVHQRWRAVLLEGGGVLLLIAGLLALMAQGVGMQI